MNTDLVAENMMLQLENDIMFLRSKIINSKLKTQIKVYSQNGTPTTAA